MTPTKEITAQDFFDAIIAKHEGSEFFIHEDDERKTVEAFNELLSQVRQQAFSAGRLQGLMEMDESHTTVEEMCDVMWRGDKEHKDALLKIDTLRSEYQKPN